MADNDEYDEEELLLDLGGDEFEGLVVDVPGGLKFPHIYQGSVYSPINSESNPQYGGTIMLDCLPPELHHQVPWKTSDKLPDLGAYVIVRSNVKPEVVPTLAPPNSGVRWALPEAELRRRAENKLVELVQRLGARNLSTDRLFIGRPLRLELRGLRMGHEFMGKSWRHVPDHVIRGYEGKFKLIPTKVWIELQEDE